MTEPTGVVAGPQIRILQCFTCKTMEEMPDYPPDADPNNDVVLWAVDEKHGGRTQQPHHRTILRIPKAVYDDRAARRQIVKQAWESVDKGFVPSYYDIKNTLMDDAVKCHIQHNRQVPCIDYRDGSKRLRAPSQSDRDRLVKDMSGAGRNTVNLEAIKHGAPQKYLCDFCPVQVAVEFERRKARGEV